jgi:hypothetical protein
MDKVIWYQQLNSLFKKEVEDLVFKYKDETEVTERLNATTFATYIQRNLKIEDYHKSLFSIIDKLYEKAQANPVPKKHIVSDFILSRFSLERPEGVRVPYTDFYTKKTTYKKTNDEVFWMNGPKPRWSNRIENLFSKIEDIAAKVVNGLEKDAFLPNYVSSMDKYDLSIRLSMALFLTIHELRLKLARQEIQSFDDFSLVDFLKKESTKHMSKTFLWVKSSAQVDFPLAAWAPYTIINGGSKEEFLITINPQTFLSICDSPSTVFFGAYMESSSIEELNSRGAEMDPPLFGSTSIFGDQRFAHYIDDSTYKFYNLNSNGPMWGKDYVIKEKEIIRLSNLFETVMSKDKAGYIRKQKEVSE